MDKQRLRDENRAAGGVRVVGQDGAGLDVDQLWGWSWMRAGLPGKASGQPANRSKPPLRRQRQGAEATRQPLAAYWHRVVSGGSVWEGLCGSVGYCPGGRCLTAS